jgi:hypothetical protein
MEFIMTKRFVFVVMIIMVILSGGCSESRNLTTFRDFRIQNNTESTINIVHIAPIGNPLDITFCTIVGDFIDPGATVRVSVPSPKTTLTTYFVTASSILDLTTYAKTIPVYIESGRIIIFTEEDKILGN